MNHGLEVRLVPLGIGLHPAKRPIVFDKVLVYGSLPIAHRHRMVVADQSRTRLFLAVKARGHGTCLVLDQLCSGEDGSGGVPAVLQKTIHKPARFHPQGAGQVNGTSKGAPFNLQRFELSGNDRSGAAVEANAYPETLGIDGQII